MKSTTMQPQRADHPGGEPTTARLFRASGLSLLIGAGAFIVHVVARSVITIGPDPAAFARGSLWVPMSALGVTGAALVLLGLPAMYARMAGPAGWLGLAGVVLVALAWAFFGLFLSLYSLLLAPWLADQAPSLVAASAPVPAGVLIAFIAGLIAELVGTALLAIPFLRGRVQPRWVGFLLPASALLTVAGHLVAPSGPAANLAVNLLSNAGPMLLMVSLGALGSRMWSVDHGAQASPVPSSK